MILTAKEISELIESGRLTFNPGLETDQVKGSAIDLRFGYNFSAYPFDTSRQPSNVQSILSQTVDLRDESRVVEFISYLRRENNQTLQE